MKLLWLYLFSLLFISNTGKSVFIKTINYVTNEPLLSTVLIYDTFQNKLDSFTVTKEGISVDLPDKELVFIIKADEPDYQRKSIVLSAEQIKDSLILKIDPRGYNRCYFGIRPIVFEKNAFAIDSASLLSLKYFRNYMIKANTGAGANLIIDVYISTDIEEKSNKEFFKSKRAEAIAAVLKRNNNLQVEIKYVENHAYPNPKNKYEHTQNRSAAFKIRNV
jgi:hypothetical protein